MNIIYNILTMFIFSSVFDGLIILTYFILDNNLEKNYRKFILSFFGISIINAVLYTFISWLGLVFQIIFILYSGLLLGVVFNIKLKKAIMSVVKVGCLVMVIEIIIAISLNTLFNIDVFSTKFGTKELMMCIPFKIMEFIIIYFCKINLNKGRCRYSEKL